MGRVRGEGEQFSVGDRRLPPLVLGVVMSVAAALLVHVTREQSLFADEWVFYSYRSHASAETLLAPHNGSLDLVSLLVYRAVFVLFGPDVSVPRLILVALELICAGLFFVLAIASYSAALPFAAGAVIAIAVRPAPLRWQRAWVVATPDAIREAPGLIWQAFAAGIASATGVFRITLPRGGFALSAAEGPPVVLSLRRFADPPDLPAASVTGGTRATLRIPADASAQPWRLLISPTRSVRVCALPGATRRGRAR